MDVEVGRVLQADRPRGDDQVAQADLRLQRAGRADAHEGRRIGDLHGLGQHDLDVVWPMPVDMQLMRMPRYVPVAVVISRLLRSSSTESHRLETLATRPGSPDEKDVLGELAPLQVDVVLAISGSRGVRLGQLGNRRVSSCVNADRGSIR